MTYAHERTSLFLEGTTASRRYIVSPEGVTLPVDLADYGERATAFVIDLVIMNCAALVAFLPVVVLLQAGVRSVVLITVFLFIAFVVRNAYFIHFELSWQGATPGKRLVGLRVVDRRGGPLLPSAVIARNLTREIELFMPLGILNSLGSAQGASWAIAGWLLFFAALPFFNRDRMRGGDLIAGTMVIALPRRALLSDLVERTSQYAFTERQLGAYGAFELQVLEELLRRADVAQSAPMLRDVCDKICRKIAWPAVIPDSETVMFLRDFYTAERAFLEREQLFGKAPADKHDRGQPRP
jgi:uncharacterized RDD family membrane protein YckC